MARKRETQEVQVLTVRVPKDLHEAIRTLAFAQRTTINAVVLRALADYMGSEGHREAVEGYLRRARVKWRVTLDKLADM